MASITRRDMIRDLGDQVSAPSSPGDWSMAERAYNAMELAGEALGAIRDAFYVTWSDSSRDEGQLCADILRVRVEPEGGADASSSSTEDDRRFILHVKDVLADRSWVITRTMQEFRELRDELKRTRQLTALIDSVKFPGDHGLLHVSSRVADSTHSKLRGFVQQMVHLLFFLGNPFYNGCLALAEFLQVEEHSGPARMLLALNASAPVATLPHPHLPSKIMMAALLSSASGLAALRRFVESDGESGVADGQVLSFCSDFCEFFPHPHTQYTGQSLSTRQVEQLDLIWRTYLEPGAQHSLREHRLAFHVPDGEAADRFAAVLQFEMELEQAVSRIYLLRFLFTQQHADYASEEAAAADATGRGSLARASLANHSNLEIQALASPRSTSSRATAGDGEEEDEDLMVELVAHVL